MLWILGILYAASLPFTYTQHKAVPALYDTGKLKDRKYMFQRLYETGLMLDGVMDTGGLIIVRDLKNLDAEQAASILEADDQEAGRATDQVTDRETHQDDDQETEYLWGKGFLVARRVRLLHASVRYLILNGSKMGMGAAAGDRAEPPDERPKSDASLPSLSDRLAEMRQKGIAVDWDQQENGLPINQEDMLFALLTFGHLIPTFLRKWGNRLSQEEQEAVLHLWKVVGYTMGVREELLTDNLDRARHIFDHILERNKGESHEAVQLTRSLRELLESCIPTPFPLRLLQLHKNIPIITIQDQLGKSLSNLLIPPDERRGVGWFTYYFAWTLWKSVRFSWKVYFPLRNFVLNLRVIKALTGSIFEDVGDIIVESWRGAFRREPFELSHTLDKWRERRHLPADYDERIRKWRKKVYFASMVGIASFMWSIFALPIAGVSYLIHLGIMPWFGWDTDWLWIARGSLIVSPFLFLLSMAILKTRLLSLIKERPAAHKKGPSSRGH